MRIRILVLVGILAALGSGVGALAGSAHHSYSPRVTNPWFPLKRGAVYVYTGVKDGQPARDVVTVTDETKLIAGVPCAVVEDRLYLRVEREQEGVREPARVHAPLDDHRRRSYGRSPARLGESRRDRTIMREER